MWYLCGRNLYFSSCRNAPQWFVHVQEYFFVCQKFAQFVKRGQGGYKSEM